MRLVFEEDGMWVALMVWGSACYHLKPRDAQVGGQLWILCGNLIN